MALVLAPQNSGLEGREFPNALLMLVNELEAGDCWVLERPRGEAQQRPLRSRLRLSAPTVVEVLRLSQRANWCQPRQTATQSQPQPQQAMTYLGSNDTVNRKDGKLVAKAAAVGSAFQGPRTVLSF